jgi:hypothetical protein
MENCMHAIKHQKCGLQLWSYFTYVPSKEKCVNKRTAGNKEKSNYFPLAPNKPLVFVAIQTKMIR